MVDLGLRCFRKGGDKGWQSHAVQDNTGVSLPTQLTSIFEGQPSKTRPFNNQNKGHLGSRYCLFTLPEINRKST